MLTIRRSTAADIDRVTEIYDSIHTAEESGDAVIGWQRGTYPTRETAESALEAGHLYVAEEDSTIVAAARINQEQEPEYYSIPWRTPAEDNAVLVLHTLVVDPAYAGRGIGPKFIAFYENIAREANCTVLRIDTNSRNARARRLYAKLGYIESGIVPTTFNGIGNVQLVCLEKDVTK